MLLDDFAEALKIPDQAIISAILPVRETNTYNIYSTDLGAKVPNSVCLDTFEEITDYVCKNAKEGDLIYLMSQRNCTILEDCTYDWVLGRSYKSGVACFFAEFLTVAEVSDGGRTLRASGATVFPFYRADGSHESVPRKPAGTVSDYPYMRDGATVRLVRPVHDVTVRDLTVIECTGSAVVGSWMRDCVIERVTVRTEEKKAPKAGLCLLRISEALDCEVR